MICKAKPYEGDEPYIFFSYCHQDAEKVYPVIEKMAGKGYRIWYDEGIHPGIDWMDYIAEKLNGSYVFLAAVTKLYTQSKYCKKELMSADKYNKHIIAFKNENFQLPSGIELQLVDVQMIMAYEYSEDDFYEKLYSGEYLCKCLDDSDKSDKIKIITEDDETVIEAEDCENKTELESKDIMPLLVQLSTGRMFSGNYSVTSIGRSKSKCDISFADIDTISSHHADIIIRNGRNYIVDNGSANNTYVNGIKIEKNCEFEINNYSEISLSKSEKFFIAFGISAEWIRKKMCLISLTSVETHEKMYFFNDEIVLGRSYPWKLNAMTDIRIGRRHAVINISENEVFITDMSKNGTFINKERIGQGCAALLHDGDNIRMGKEHFIFSSLRLTCIEP